MAHLTCTDHKKRIMVLSDGTAVHRENSKRCFTNTVKIGGKRHTTDDVLYFHVSTSAIKAIARLRHAPKIDISAMTENFIEKMEPIREGLKKFGSDMKKVGEAVLQATDILAHQDRLTEQLLENTFGKPRTPRGPAVREEQLLKAVFGNLEDVARDTTLGTAHITSTSEGLSTDVEIKRPKIDAFLDEYRNEIVADDHFPRP